MKKQVNKQIKLKLELDIDENKEYKLDAWKNNNLYAGEVKKRLTTRIILFSVLKSLFRRQKDLKVCFN